MLKLVWPTPVEAAQRSLSATHTSPSENLPQTQHDPKAEASTRQSWPGTSVLAMNTVLFLEAAKGFVLIIMLKLFETSLYNDDQ